MSTRASGGGDVSPSSLAIIPGQAASFSISPSPDFKIDTITGCDGALEGSTYSIESVNSSCTIAVNFIPASFFHISLSSGEGGRFQTSSSQLIAGGRLELALFPEPDYIINDVVGCGGALDGFIYTVPSVAEDCAITASFRLGSFLALQGSPIKNLQFSWGETPWATHYKLFENVDGASVFAQVGADITGGMYSHLAPLHLRANAQYQLHVCNEAQCDIANTVSMSNEVLVDSIGYVKASNANHLDLFGYVVKVSSDGSTLAVSSKDSSNTTGINGDQANNSAEDSGAVYVFSKTGGEWVQQAYIKASNTEAGDHFGSTIDLSSDGSILVVGAPDEASNSTGINGNESDNSGSAVGAVYVYARDQDQWSQQAYIKAINAPPSGYILKFGRDVALDAEGDTLAVGSLYSDVNENGPVHMFARAGDVWSFQQMVAVAGGDNGDDVGQSLELSADGNTLVVGARFEDSAATLVNGDESDNSLGGAGAVYVLKYDGATWVQQAYLKASNPGENHYFGEALAVSSDGNVLAVGVKRESSPSVQEPSSNTLPFSGAVYIYRLEESGWVFFERLKASNAAEMDRFGESIDFNEDASLLVVGASFEDGEGRALHKAERSYRGEDSGAAYLFELTGDGYKEVSYIKAKNTHENASFGVAVSLNDTGDTLVVGSPREDGISSGVGGNHFLLSDTNSGAVYIY